MSAAYLSLCALGSNPVFFATIFEKGKTKNEGKKSFLFTKTKTTEKKKSKKHHGGGVYFNEFPRAADRLGKPGTL
jgi:hypothetical protein